MTEKGDLYMKATGIVRRIDDLGRVVIPKEIRRTMRIREGDPLEIYTDNDGEVIFKKYSPIGEMNEFASQIAESVSATTNLPIVILDRDHCIAAAGIAKKEVLERRITPQAEELLENRMKFVSSSDSDEQIQPLEGIDRYAGVFVPIISSGDITGAVITLKNNKSDSITETDEKICTIAADFLAKQTEE